MIGSTRLLTSLSQLIKRTRADGISVSAHARTRQVFRFAYGSIHQDLIQEGITVTVKVIQNGCVGISSTDSLESGHLSRAVASAKQLAKHSPKQENLPPLPQRHRLATSEDHIRATAAVKPDECVSLLKRLYHLSQGAGAELAGSLMNGEEELAVCNSEGVRCYASSTVAAAKLVTIFQNLHGCASGTHRDIRQLDLEGLLKRSLKQSLHETKPVRPPLSSYEVILEPEAVAELMTWLSVIAFGAKSFQEHTSFLSGRIGDTLMSDSVTIMDDGNEPELLRLPFDFEGVPKQKVLLIDRGRAAGIVYDTQYGSRFGKSSTGHAMPADESEGPFPLNLVVAPGQSSLEAMIRSCKKGLFISRFHYVNGLLNPREALMTGLTREGAFLIEDGVLTFPIIAMRFTMSMLQAFSQVIAISKERRLVAEPSQEFGCVLAPAFHLKSLTFTGHSEG
ncbi:MAG: TldD/PmbA family protein [Candidatus Omnitrophica bacterium]|nr:TldD/PmbA family protein [Candidatus Omnitrophota bacterium]